MKKMLFDVLTVDSESEDEVKVYASKNSNNSVGTVRATMVPSSGQDAQIINLGQASTFFPSQVKNRSINYSRKRKSPYRYPIAADSKKVISEKRFLRSLADGPKESKTLNPPVTSNPIIRPSHIRSKHREQSMNSNPSVETSQIHTKDDPSMVSSPSTEESSHDLTPVWFNDLSQSVDDEIGLNESSRSSHDLTPLWFNDLSQSVDDEIGLKESSTPERIMTKDKNDKNDELIAIHYRKQLKGKTPAKFKLITSNVYPSCSCKGTKNGCKTNACTCIRVLQECQPTCGCMDRCPNMDLTRGEGKKLRIGASEVHGEGCFTEEDVKKGEFIGEYCGEIVTRDEQDKKNPPSLYLFETGDKDFLLDASKFGSKLSKMNHRFRGANSKFQVKRVGGEWRVGVWAISDIGGGQELFANYGFKYRGHGLITPYAKRIGLSDVN